MSSARRRRHRGFNLAELMITLAMFGVMTGIAVSSLRQLVTKDVESGSARTVASLLKRARIQAVSAHARVVVVLTTTPTNTMSLSSCRAVYGGRPLCVTEEPTPTPVVGGSYTFGRGDFRGVKVTGPASGTVVFATDGSLEGQVPVAFTVDHSQIAGVRTVTVSAAGDVRVQ
jgi:type IV fimbrial biogenesis protein FimT